MWKKAFEINGNNFDRTLKFIFQILSWLSVIHILGVLLHVVFPRPFKMFVFLFLINALGLLKAFQKCSKQKMKWKMKFWDLYDLYAVYPRF